MAEKERTIACVAGILEGVQAHLGRTPHGGPLDGSAYPRARGVGRALRPVLPPPGLPDLPVLDRRLGRLHRPADHQRGLAGHRPGRQAAPRHRLCRLPLRRLGMGRPGDRPGHTDPDPPGPRRRGLGRRGRHPLPQARCQGRLRRHLPRRRALVEEAQDLPVRPELGGPGGRRADPDAPGSLLLPAGALAALPQEGAGRVSVPAPGRRDAGAAAGRGQPRADLLAGRRQCLCQCRDVAGPPREPPGDRAVALEGGVVRPARASRSSGGRRARRGTACRIPGR